MINDLDQFYLNLEEPAQGCMIALRDVLLSIDDDITPEWKYRLPFFYYKGKMLAYLWKDKLTQEPYIGIANGGAIDHPCLEQGDRKRMKIFRVDPNQDIPVDDIREVIALAIKVSTR
jgi:hypothetical protein